MEITNIGGYPDPSDDIWEQVEHFDSTKNIELYWGRHNAEKDTTSSNKRKALPQTVNSCQIPSRNKRNRISI
ncbi:hypothetical protein RMCBS344292_15661 [Rhizopus microsporus]|nr:hypothetical protein RMCBS344292_15661 [Rhizopus microsporus]